ncbi:FtsK/SpoIIIE domain-containing protein [Nonomuraea sp. ZG12]|uniref:FtsK/SpoIIIE domain-containing protein n=1 Tax=Nonomuraea sp. ZG12 TaxID=3452207 RepID=UPI003F8B202F
METGKPWVVDFRTVPHWLNAGATQSGKSNLANALIVGLAPQPVALVGFDLKGGVEFTPYAPRLSALATNRAECGTLLDDLVTLMTDRMGVCRMASARNIWQLPPTMRPVPVVVLVDELAELYLMADKSEKDEIAKTSTALLRVAQLGRGWPSSPATTASGTKPAPSTSPKPRPNTPPAPTPTKPRPGPT